MSLKIFEEKNVIKNSRRDDGSSKKVKGQKSYSKANEKNVKTPVRNHK